MQVDEEIEIINSALPRGRFKSVLFDFDGTLSLIREGWPQVMIPMMVDVLRQTGTAESDADLYSAVEHFVMQLNGRQTIYQMIHLADEVRRRGGQPEDPLVYKHRYHNLLLARIRDRLDALAEGRATPADWTVPGSHALLDSLRRRGLTLYLAVLVEIGAAFGLYFSAGSFRSDTPVGADPGRGATILEALVVKDVSEAKTEAAPVKQIAAPVSGPRRVPRMKRKQNSKKNETRE